MGQDSQEEDSQSERGGCPVLVTERLVLRTPHIEDTDALACLANNARVATMVSRMPHPYTRMDATDFIRRAKKGAIGKCVYAVTNTDDGRFLGCCGIEPQDNPSTLELDTGLVNPIGAMVMRPRRPMRSSTWLSAPVTLTVLMCAAG